MTAAAAEPVETRLPDGLGQEPVENAAQEDDDQVFWSVTTVIGALDKPALLYWSAQMAAEAAIDNEAVWKAMVDDRGRDEAVKWLRDARFRAGKGRLSAADLGTVVHTLGEEWALSGTRPDKHRVADAIKQKAKSADVKVEGPVVWAMLDRFDEWLQRFQPSYDATEVAVYSPTYGVAGTCDGFLTIEGFRAIVDYKTSREPLDSRGQPKTPYPEVALQLAAYRFSELAAVWRPRRTEKFRRRYYLLSAAERAASVPVPEVDGALCIHITPESCEAYPIRADRKVHQAFLYVLEAARWKFETEKTVIGLPLEEPTKETTS